MVRNVDYGERRRSILAATINKYIHDAEPVASEDIADTFELSSATIRNVLADLEENGFLTHPYTSGGKVPTDKGYRYYVDFLISQMQLLDEQKGRILKEFSKEVRRLEDALEETSEIVSRLTHYAAIVSLLEWQDRFFYRGVSRILDEPEFQDLKRMRMLIRLIEDKKNILDVVNRDFSGKVKVYIGKELGHPEMDNCALVVSRYNLKKKPQGRLAVLGPARMEYEQIIPMIEYVSEVLSEVLDKI